MYTVFDPFMCHHLLVTWLAPPFFVRSRTRIYQWCYQNMLWIELFIFSNWHGIYKLYVTWLFSMGFAHSWRPYGDLVLIYLCHLVYCVDHTTCIFLYLLLVYESFLHKIKPDLCLKNTNSLMPGFFLIPSTEKPLELKCYTESLAPLKCVTHN